LQRRREQLNRRVVPCAGLAVEEDAWTFKASAKPSPTAEAGAPTEVTRSRLAALETSRDCTTMRHSPSLTLTW
jgi:hypothetical protein